MLQFKDIIHKLEGNRARENMYQHDYIVFYLATYIYLRCRVEKLYNPVKDSLCYYENL